MHSDAPFVALTKRRRGRRRDHQPFLPHQPVLAYPLPQKVRIDPVIQGKLSNRRSGFQTAFDQTRLRYRIKPPPPTRMHCRHPQLAPIIFHNLVSTSFLVDTSCPSKLNRKRCGEIRAYTLTKRRRKRRRYARVLGARAKIWQAVPIGPLWSASRLRRRYQCHDGPCLWVGEAERPREFGRFEPDRQFAQGRGMLFGKEGWGRFFPDAAVK